MLLGWLCIYPIINITSYVLSPFVDGWHMLLKSFFTDDYTCTFNGNNTWVFTKKI